jgi:hypothetical protein
MSTERCDAAQAALTDAFFAHGDPDADTVAHVEGCASCTFARREIETLARELDGLPEAVPPSALALRTRRFARMELAAARESTRGDELVPSNGAALPPGFARECARLLAGALAALPLVVAWNALVLWVGGGVLASLLPEPVLGVVAGAYVASVAGGLAFLYGSIPFVAHRRARRSAEVP